MSSTAYSIDISKVDLSNSQKGRANNLFINILAGLRWDDLSTDERNLLRLNYTSDVIDILEQL